jgi:aspartyl protease family protein
MVRGARLTQRPPGRPGGCVARSRWRPAIASALLCALAAAAHAQSVTYNGMLGDRALLIIDGKAQTVPVGGSAQGVKLLKLDDNRAQIDIGGRALSLRLGGSVKGGGVEGGPNGSRIILPASGGGHFLAQGSINGHPVNFVVDTGATLIAMGRDEAERLGLDMKTSAVAGAMTANGAVTVRTLTLTSVRVGDVLVSDVPAVVMPQAMPYVLLGNSFLSRFQVHIDNDTMVLDKKN